MAYATITTKQPLKYIEVPLNKFTEEVIPHHQKIFEKHKANIKQLVLVNNEDQIRRELKDKKRLIKQLRDLMYELDTLRTQVEDVDLDKFDMKTLSLRKIILNLINGYTELEKTESKFTKPDEDINKENCDPFQGASQIQIHENLENLKLMNHQDQLNKVENVTKDVGELHEMYKQLHEMVDDQGQGVNHIEEAVESTQHNVEKGTKYIIKAHKLKAVAYPVTGAFLGGMIGGPIGLIAGLKIGGVAALGCAIAGYTGGKYFKKFHNPDNIERDNKTEDEVVEDTSQKKDI